MRPGHKTRLNKLSRPLADTERQKVVHRNMLRLDALLCAYIRDAIVRAGIDPACAWGLRQIEARVAEFVDTLELQAADAAFKAADEGPFCWAGPRDQLQTKLDRIGQHFLDGSLPDFAHAPFMELWAWAMVQADRAADFLSRTADNQPLSRIAGEGGARAAGVGG